MDILLIILIDLLDSTDYFPAKDEIRSIIKKLEEIYILEETRIRIEEKLNLFYQEMIKKGSFISKEFTIFFIYKLAKQATSYIKYPERRYWVALVDLTYNHTLKKQINDQVLLNFQKLYSIIKKEQFGL